jgi:hypothetical protein
LVKCSGCVRTCVARGAHACTLTTLSTTAAAATTFTSAVSATTFFFSSTCAAGTSSPCSVGACASRATVLCAPDVECGECICVSCTCDCIWESHTSVRVSERASAALPRSTHNRGRRRATREEASACFNAAQCYLVCNAEHTCVRAHTHTLLLSFNTSWQRANNSPLASRWAHPRPVDRPAYSPFLPSRRRPLTAG